MMMAIISL